ncbi:hypothetical protein [Roseixanthobacter glucoisosaccharinicivorans]|uniref:hypothetical protein n=1 Tax=Roseixanthobacter glucoisosaccharinicivorans TaxID=3119923 RepID=UPI003727A39E
MGAVTFSTDSFSTSQTADAVAAKPAEVRKGVFARIFDAIVAARAAQAERDFITYMQRTGFDPRK